MEIISAFVPPLAQRFSLDAFQQPSVDCAPVYSWVWNERLSRAETLRQLDEMARLGVRALYVIPEPKHFRPTSMPTDLEPEYLSDEYLAHYRFAMEEAARRGMRLWLYDEGGWPSGGACGQVLREHPELARCSLVCRTVSYKKGERYRMPASTAAAFVRTTVPIADGFLFVEDTQVDEYESQPRPIHATDYPDLLLAESTDAFIQMTHEAYAAQLKHLFGNALTAVFTDEPKAPELPFRAEWVQAFETEYGCSLLPYLPYIAGRAPADGRAADALIDYYELCSRLFCQQYLLRERAWSNKNGLAFTGHMDHDDAVSGAYSGRHFQTLRALRCLDIPGVDAIWRQIWKTKQEKSAGYAFFPRMASSAAAQNGGGRSMSESFGVYGPGLTYDEMRYVLGAQAIRGINIWNLMVWPYGQREHYGAGELPAFNEAAYPDLAEMNRYMERLSYLTSIGRADQTIALYFPSRALHVPGLRGDAETAFMMLGNEMEEKGLPFDLVDDDALEAASPEGIQAGEIRLGLAAYSVLVVPDARKMPEKSRQTLARFAQHGGKIYTQTPIPGLMQARPWAEGKTQLSFDQRVQAPCGVLCQKRILENGTLLLFWNGTDTVQQVDFLGAETLYQIRITEGRIYAGAKHMELCPGETAAFLLTQETLPAETPQEKGVPRTLEPFTFRRTRRFSIGAYGRKEETAEEPAVQAVLGDWRGMAGADFSGSGIYQVSFTAQPGKESVLDLGDVRYACEAFLNGRSLGVRVMPPYRYAIPAALMEETNLLSLRVTNSVANAYCAADAFSGIEPWKLSSYFPQEICMGRDSLSGGLIGPVLLWENA